MTLESRLRAHLARPWSADPLTLDRDDAAAVVGLLSAAKVHRWKVDCQDDDALDAAIAAFGREPLPGPLLTCEFCGSGPECAVCGRGRQPEPTR